MEKLEQGFPTMEEIKRDYNELMELIKNIETIEQLKELDKFLDITINDDSIEKFSKYYSFNDIEFIRYEWYGCLSYIYQRANGEIWFDVWSDYCGYEFIQDITIDKLTEELYEKSIEKAKMSHK